MLQNRFQIEEMLSQDANGAVFLAIDAETDKEVLLQRFFPFGAGSGGLEGEEQSSYRNAVALMKGLEHPALRRVLDGGCDPVDGIPFLVTEAREGVSLAEFFAAGPINAEQGRALAESALDLMLAIEQVFGQGADWLVLTADEVEVIGEGQGFRFTVDPMKWLGIKKGPGAIKELGVLVETALGWSGRIVAGSTAGLLSGWVRSTKTEVMGAQEAWNVLQGGAPPSRQVVQAPPTLAPALAAPAPPVYQAPLASAKSGSSTGLVILGCVLGVGAMAAVGVFFYNAQQAKTAAAKPVAAGTKTPTVIVENGKAAAAAPAATVADAADQGLTVEDKMRAEIERKARELQGISGKESSKKSTTAKKEKDKPASAKRDGDYQPQEWAEVKEQMSEEISVLGKVSKVRMSQSGKSVYIEFEGDAAKTVCGRYLTNLGKEGMSVSELGAIEGKTVRITGVVQEEFGTNRIVVNLITRDQVKEQD